MIEDPSLIFLLSILISLLIISGFFSGSETGMMAANKIKLRNLSKKSKTSAKRALNLLKRPDQLLSAILVGNNFANILASAIVTIIMINYFGGNVDGGNFNCNSPINGSQANTGPSFIVTAKDTLLWNFTSASTGSQDDPHWIDCGTATNQFGWTLDAEL